MPPRDLDTSAAVPPVVIIGAGPTGLSAAYHLGKESTLVEQADRVGGWCRSIEDHGFTFDMAGHIMFSNDAYVHEMYQLLLGDNMHWQDREAWIYSKQVYTRYPFQGALYGLPHEVLKECIVGAIEARFGPLKADAQGHSNGHDPAPLNGKKPALTAVDCKAESITDCCGDGIAESTTRLRAVAPRSTSTPRRVADYANFEEFIYGVWGWGVAKH